MAVAVVLCDRRTGTEYRPELAVDHLFDERFSMVATMPCALEDVRPESYLFVASSPYFKARHGELLPELQHAPLSIATGPT